MADHPYAPPPRDQRPGLPGPRRPIPLAVRYARMLLGLQACIWAELAVLALVVAVYGAVQIFAANLNLFVGVGAALVTCGLASSFAVVKVYLARAIARGEDRKVVIAVEITMAGLGVIMAANSTYSDGVAAVLFGLAGIVGASLSLAAVAGLLRGRGKQYFATPDDMHGVVGSDGSWLPAGHGTAWYRTCAPVGAA